MRVLMMTDLEGVSGVVGFDDQTFPSGKYYEQAKRLLTAEVNAAVDGMLEEGVHDVLVLDGHGAGGIVFEDLHPRARLMHGRPFVLRLPEQLEYLRSEFDVSVMIGQHAMAGTPDGNLNHTQSSRTVESYTLNGRPIGELAQWALYCGALGLPVIFLSGDEAACREAEALIDGITTAAVKKGLSRTSAISLAAPEARRRVREGARSAMRRHRENPVAPLVWPGPYTLEKRFLFTETADVCSADPLFTRVDAKTVRGTAADILDLIYA